MASNENEDPVVSHRIYLAHTQLPEIIESTELEARQKALEEQVTEYFTNHLGHVPQEVFVPRNPKKDYAFVALTSIEAAQQALQQDRPPTHLFESMRPAFTMVPTQKRRNENEMVEPDSKRARLWQTEYEKMKVVLPSNILLQVHKSHAERVVDFLATRDDILTTGSIPTAQSTKVCWVHVQPKEDSAATVRWLEQLWYIQPVIQRIYNFPSPSSVQGSLAQVVQQCALLLQKLPTSARIRLAIFPPKLQSTVLTMMEKTNIEFSPKDPTHTLGIVQLVVGSQDTSNDQDGLFAFGISPIPKSNMGNSKNFNNQTACCRAYWKLQETMERYTTGPLPPKGGTAIDVGASPGGWTQFLAVSLQCQTVYSIDPGELTWQTTSTTIVHHLRQTFDKALPQVAQTQKGVQFYVSDMCVKDVSSQLDALLQAVDLGLVVQGTFVVLTIKCNQGHSKATFDRVVDKQVERLFDPTSKVSRMKHLQIIHLFCNRRSERTIVGYWA